MQVPKSAGITAIRDNAYIIRKNTVHFGSADSINLVEVDQSLITDNKIQMIVRIRKVSGT